MVSTGISQQVKTHSSSPQSSSAGQRRKPVLSCSKPRFAFMFQDKGGCRGSPLEGTIQSRMAPLRLFVSSDLALEAPFWSFEQRC